MNYKDIIVRQFKKYGSNGRYTKAYPDIDEGEDKLIQQIKSAHSVNGQPLVIVYSDSDNWTLITSGQLSSSQEGQVWSVQLSNVTDATVDYEVMRLGGSDINKWQQLLIITEVGSMRLILEPGAPYIGVWNALKAVAAQNKRADTTP
jgi:hypothetical protein